MSGAFSGPKTRPAAVAEQTGRLTWIFFVVFEESLQRVKKTARLFKVTELLQNSIEFIQAAVAYNQFAFTPGCMLNPHRLTQFV